MAIADQGLAIQGLPLLDSTSASDYAMQDALYNLPASDFHEITSGSNGGESAGPGYNLVTGLGSPVANQLIPDLVAKYATYAAQYPLTVSLDGSGNLVITDDGSPVTTGMSRSRLIPPMAAT